MVNSLLTVCVSNSAISVISNLVPLDIVRVTIDKEFTFYDIREYESTRITQDL
jgi:hypothetical protein